MVLPQAAEYGEAIQNLPASFCDPEIRAGRTSTGLRGQPLIWNGNFAAVFQVCGAAPGQKWALKCFTRQVKGLQERYRRIDAHLRQQRLPFMVGFRYLPDEVLVRGQRFPVLKMDWVEGLRLDEFLADCFEKGNAKGTLRMLCEMWVKLARRMRAADVTHGDLQHGNVILVPVPGKEAYNLRLIDYDGLHVPALADMPPGEVGHAAYQHPERLATGAFGPEIDRFSHLLIYTTLRCLIAGGRELWERHYNEERLLLGPRDIAAPQDSPLCRELWELADPDASSLVGHLVLAARGPLDKVPALNQIVEDSNVVALSETQRERVATLLSEGAGAEYRFEPLPQLLDAAGSAFANLTPDDLQSTPSPTPLRRISDVSSPPQRLPNVPRVWWVAGGVSGAVTVLILLAGLILVLTRSGERGPVAEAERSRGTVDRGAEWFGRSSEDVERTPGEPEDPQWSSLASSRGSEVREPAEKPHAGKDASTPPQALSPQTSAAVGTKVSWKGKLHRIFVADHPAGSSGLRRRDPIMHLLVKSEDPGVGASVFEAVTTDLSFARELADYESELEAPGRADSVEVRGEVLRSEGTPRLEERGPLLKLHEVQRETGGPAVVGRLRHDLQMDEEQIALATQLRTEGTRVSFRGTVNAVSTDGSVGVRVYLDVLNRYCSVAVPPENLGDLQTGDEIDVAAIVTSRYASYEVQGRVYRLPLLQGTLKSLPERPPFAIPSDERGVVAFSRPVLEILGERVPVRVLSWSPDGGSLVTGGEGARVTVWNVAARRHQPRHLSGDWTYATALSWPDDGRIILLRTVRIVERRRGFRRATESILKCTLLVAKTHNVLRDFDVDPSYSNGILATVDGRLVTVGPYPHVKTTVTQFPVSGEVVAIALSPDGGRIAIANTSRDTQASLSVRRVQRSQAESATAESTDLSYPSSAGQRTSWLTWRRDGQNNGDRLMARLDTQIVCWHLDAAGGRPPEPAALDLPMTGYGAGLGVENAVSWSTDGRLLAAVRDTRTHVFRMTNGFKWFAEISGTFCTVAFAPDSHRLACLSPDGEVSVYDLNDESDVVQFQSSRPATLVAWDPRGRRLAIGHNDGTVTVWDQEGQAEGKTETIIDIEAKVKELDTAGERGDWAEFHKLLEMIRDQRPSGRYLRILQAVVQKYPR